MAEWKSGQVILGEYAIEKELGRGGMGRVWLVKSNSTGRRFAVKQTLLKEDKHRKAFLAELQTWIDLPEHPNIVPCRFFRTVGDDVLIFSDFVEGGSLKTWIDSGRLYEGGHRKALEQILDTAIQFAWGLHSIHELGLVHQDVKPGNVLMSNEAEAVLQGMRVQVSDYGLARARARSGAQDVQEAGEGSILLSSGGYTPAYCSPEQAKGVPITRKTDLWSWGVSVLEMFTGGVIWHSGHLADAVLDQYVEDVDESSGIPVMPSALADILRKCFQNDPAKRWSNLGEVVGHLKTAYSRIAGEDYDRELVQTVPKSQPKTGVIVRRGVDGTSWHDPREWLEAAFRLDGRNPAEAEEILERSVASRRGQLVADLAMYEEAKRIFERLVNRGRKDLTLVLVQLYAEKAVIHSTSDDVSGAIVEYDACLAILKRLVEHEGRRELANELAGTIMNKASALKQLGDLSGAVGLYGDCIAIYRQVVEQEGRREFVNELARALNNNALAHADLGDLRGAVRLYDECIAIRRRLVQQEGRRDLAANLAAALMNKASALKQLGDLRRAIELYDESLAVYRQLVKQEGRRELAADLAMALMNSAFTHADLGDLPGAIELYDECIAIYRQLVEQEGRRELAGDLAMALMDKALAVTGLGDLRGAVGLYDECIAIRRRLVEQEGRRDLAANLAAALMNKGIAITDLGDLCGAAGLFDECIAIYRQLVEKEGRRELAGNLATAVRNRTVCAGLLRGKGIV